MRVARTLLSIFIADFKVPQALRDRRRRARPSRECRRSDFVGGHIERLGRDMNEKRLSRPSISAGRQ
jgi:hypothetical protein